MFYHHWLISHHWHIKLKEKSKRGFYDTIILAMNVENQEIVEHTGHALIFEQKRIRDELYLIFVASRTKIFGHIL